VRGPRGWPLLSLTGKDRATPAEHLYDTMTRTEALRLRGYDEATVNGNGHSASPAVPEPAPAPSERICRVCGEPVPPARARNNAKTCSQACSDLDRKRRQADRRPAKRPRPAKALVESGASVRSSRQPALRAIDTKSQSVDSPRSTHTKSEKDPSGELELSLVGVVAALATAGLTITLEVDGIPLTCRV
jgi:hypothetical protein